MLTNQNGNRLGLWKEARLDLLGIDGLTPQRLYATYMKRLQEQYHTQNLQILQDITGRDEMTAVEWEDATW